MSFWKTIHTKKGNCLQITLREFTHTHVHVYVPVCVYTYFLTHTRGERMVRKNISADIQGIGNMDKE